MFRQFLTISFFLLHLILAAQSTVRVPSHMTFADVKLKITDKGRNAIQEEVDRIMQSPKYFNAKVEKADIYFPIIERAFKEEGVSPDFKYLSLQESALIADAVSTSNAVGFWQFKDFTAIEMGLRVDKYVDERMNIYASSRAAARYMKKNNSYFDNWIFALQAYQMGAGAALDAINSRHYGARSVTITDKTYWYVRTFLAHKIAYEQAVGKNTPKEVLAVYKSGQGKSLHQIADKMNMETEILEEYNIWLRKGKIPTDKEYAVIMPSTELSRVDLLAESDSKPPKHTMRKIADFDFRQSAKFPEIEEDRGYHANANWVKINGIPGIVAKEGATISDLAKHGGVALSKFLDINDATIDHWVKPNQVFYFKKKKSKAKLYYHVVQPDETLWSISQKYGIKLKKLLLKNRMKGVQEVKMGRVLWLRHIRPASTPIEYKEVKVEEKPIDVFLPVKKKEKEVEFHPIDLPFASAADTLKGGNAFDHADSSIVEIDEKYSREQDNLQLIKHEVKAGETLYRISKIYSVEVLELVEWNRLRLTDDINAGQQLIVFTDKKVASDKTLSENNKLHEITYKVKTGETLYKIAKNYEVTVQEIVEWNKKEDHNVKVGEELVIMINKNPE